jgi:ATP-dependent DNA ligase
LNLDFDETRISRKLGDYCVGPATALSDPLFYPRAQEYRRRLSGQMRLTAAEDFWRIPKASGYYGSRKYDGEFTLVAFDGKKIVSVNSGGTVRCGLPCFAEAAAILSEAKVKSCLLGAEIYVTGDTGKRNRVHHVFKILRNPKSTSDLDKLGLAVFDIIELDEKPVPACADVFAWLEKCFGKGKLSHVAEFRVLETLDAVKELFEKWVVGDGSEGLVIRHDQAGWFKLKVRHNIDAAVIGFSEGTDERKGMLHDLLVAVMRDDGTYHELTRVGGGFSEEERRTFAEELRKRIVPSSYVAVNNDYVAYEMIEPGPVIEISCLDVISENTKGGPVNRMVLDWDENKYSPLSRMPLVSIISPQFIRMRDDKEANVEDVNIRQLAELVEIPDVAKAAHESVAPPSEILERVVYTKMMKGNKMVRKLLLWKTNKDEDEFPAYVVYLTDFSPNRMNPLERDMRVTSKEKSARELFAEMAAKNFVGGWEKVL